MKTTNLMIVGGALLMMISCDNTERDNERKEAKDDLKSFVDSVDRVATERIDHDWTALDRRYDALEQRAEAAFMNAEDQDLEELREIEADYEEAKIEAKTKLTEMTETSQMHLERVEAWRESRTTAAGTPNTAANAVDEMDATVKESVDWLEDNLENMGSDMKTRYERIRMDVRGDDNTATNSAGNNPAGTRPPGSNPN